MMLEFIVEQQAAAAAAVTSVMLEHCCFDIRSLKTYLRDIILLFKCA